MSYRLLRGYLRAQHARVIFAEQTDSTDQRYRRARRCSGLLPGFRVSSGERRKASQTHRLRANAICNTTNGPQTQDFIDLTLSFESWTIGTCRKALPGEPVGALQGDILNLHSNAIITALLELRKLAQPNYAKVQPRQGLSTRYCDLGRLARSYINERSAALAEPHWRKLRVSGRS